MGSQAAIDAANQAAIAASQASDGIDNKIGGIVGTIDDKISISTSGAVETATKGILSTIWSTIMGYGWMATGLGGVAVFLGYRFAIKPLADKLDGEKDGRINLMGIVETIRWRLDKIDGVVDGTYTHNPQVMAQAEAMRAANLAAQAGPTPPAQ